MASERTNPDASIVRGWFLTEPCASPLQAGRRALEIAALDFGIGGIVCRGSHVDDRNRSSHPARAQG